METRTDPFENQFSLSDLSSLKDSEKQSAPKADPASKAAPPAKKLKDVVQQKGTTMTGEPADQVVINPDKDPLRIMESGDSTAVMAFGRMNPPTVGHEKLIHKVESVAKDHGGSAHIIASHSEGTSKDPLPQKAKIGYIKKIAHPDTNVAGSSKSEPTIMHAAAKLHSQGHKHLVVVAGQDRVEEYHKLLHKYNGVEGKHGHYNFKSIKVVSAGQRDPDAEGTEGMSGTKMRGHARAGEMKQFKSGLPKALHQHADEIANHIRSVKEEVELEEGATLQVRLHRAQVMRRNAKKLEQARNLARKRLARLKNLQRRAQKRARAMMRTRLAGQRGHDYSKLTSSDKIAIDKMADKRKAQIARIATRIAPRVKRADMQRLAAIASGKKVQNMRIPVVASFEHPLQNILTEKAAKALKNKAEQAGIRFEQLIEVYQHGIEQYQQNEKQTAQQFAFARVNSFLAGGKALAEEHERRGVSYTARDMTTVDFSKLPKVLPMKLHAKMMADIADMEKTDPDKAARKKADIIRRNTTQQYRKVVESAKEIALKRIEEASVFKRAANKLTRRQSPQLAKMKQDLVDALKKKNYAEAANIILYLTRNNLSDKRVVQEDVCIPEDDYIYEEWTIEQWEQIEASINEQFMEGLDEENNEGRKLNKPFRTPGGPKKFAVYVKNDKGNVIKLGFGDPNLEIKRDDPDRRKAYRARHGCDNPGPKWKANYWSCNWSWSASKKVGA